jgi:hypothetical protein
MAGAQCVSDLVKSGHIGHIETVAIDPTGTWMNGKAINSGVEVRIYLISMC